MPDDRAVVVCDDNDLDPRPNASIPVPDGQSDAGESLLVGRGGRQARSVGMLTGRGLSWTGSLTLIIRVTRVEATVGRWPAV